MLWAWFPLADTGKLIRVLEEQPAETKKDLRRGLTLQLDGHYYAAKATSERFGLKHTHVKILLRICGKT